MLISMMTTFRGCGSGGSSLEPHKELSPQHKPSPNCAKFSYVRLHFPF